MALAEPSAVLPTEDSAMCPRIIAALLTVLLTLPSAKAASITVTTLLDNRNTADGLCSLWEAVFAASLDLAVDTCVAGSGADTITVSADLCPPPLNLCNIGLTGPIDVGGNNLAIAVPDGKHLTIDGTGTEPVFRLSMSGQRTFSLTNMTLRFGRNAGPGGAIAVQSGVATVDLIDVKILDSHSDTRGGAIGFEIPGPFVLNVQGGLVAGNSSVQDGVPRGSAIGGRGAWVEVNIDGTRFENNLGGAINLIDAHLDLDSDQRLELNLSNALVQGTQDATAISILAGSPFVPVRASILNVRVQDNERTGVLLRHEVQSDAMAPQRMASRLAIDRSSFSGNNLDLSASGSTVESHQVAVAIRNSAFMENRSRVQLFNAPGVVAGNTFWRNDVPNPNNFAGVANELAVTYQGAASWGAIQLAGNAFVPVEIAPGSNNRPCRFFDLATTAASGYNRFLDVPHIDTCVRHASDAILDDLGLALQSGAPAPHGPVPRPTPGSVLVDAFPDPECAGAGLIDSSLVGPRRAAGTPVNGNPLTPPGCDVGAVEAGPGRTLTVTLEGTGAGVVGSSPNAIQCPGTCQTYFVQGTRVHLNATAEEGSVFTGWGGACSGTGACSITLHADAVVQAGFDASAVPTFPVSVVITGLGSGTVVSDPSGIDCPGVCAAPFPQGSTVTLSHAADDHSQYGSWSGSCAGQGPGPCVLTNLGAAASPRIRFDPILREVEVQVLGAGGRVFSIPGGIDCPGACSADFASGSSLQLSADPESGSQFLGWGGDCSGEPQPDCVLALSADRQVSASFGAIVPQRRLTVTLTGAGQGRVIADVGGIDCPDQCEHDYLDGTTLVLDATPEPGSLFAGWGPPCAGTASCELLLDADVQLEANFEILTHPLAVSVVGHGRVQSDPSGIDCPGTCVAPFASGLMVALAAHPEPGAELIDWFGDCESVTPTHCFLQVTAKSNVQAHFTTVVLEEAIFQNGFE